MYSVIITTAFLIAGTANLLPDDNDQDYPQITQYTHDIDELPFVLAVLGAPKKFEEEARRGLSATNWMIAGKAFEALALIGDRSDHTNLVSLARSWKSEDRYRFHRSGMALIQGLNENTMSPLDPFFHAVLAGDEGEPLQLALCETLLVRASKETCLGIVETLQKTEIKPSPLHKRFVKAVKALPSGQRTLTEKMLDLQKTFAVLYGTKVKHASRTMIIENVGKIHISRLSTVQHGHVGSVEIMISQDASGWRVVFVGNRRIT